MSPPESVTLPRWAAVMLAGGIAVSTGGFTAINTRLAGVETRLARIEGRLGIAESTGELQRPVGVSVVSAALADTVRGHEACDSLGAGREPQPERQTDEKSLASANAYRDPTLIPQPHGVVWRTGGGATWTDTRPRKRVGLPELSEDLP